MSISPFSARSTWWIITAYNKNIELVENVDTYPPQVKAVHGGREQCPDTGREHYQGAIECHGQQRATFFRAWLPGVHFEPAKSGAAVKKYCLKSDTAIGPKGTLENPTPFLKLDDQLRMIAIQYVHEKEHIMARLEKKNTPLKDYFKEEYWELACLLLNDSPTHAGMLANPAVEKMWIRTRSVWIAKALLDPDCALVLQAQTDEANWKGDESVDNLLSPVQIQTNGFPSEGWQEDGASQASSTSPYSEH